MEHIYSLLLLVAECKGCGLLVEVLLKSRNTHCLLLFLQAAFPPTFFFLLMTGALLYSSPSTLPFGNGYSYCVSTCFASSCQFILVCAYKTYCNPMTFFEMVQTISVQPNFLLPVFPHFLLAKYTVWGFVHVFCFYSVCGGQMILNLT